MFFNYFSKPRGPWTLIKTPFASIHISNKASWWSEAKNFDAIHCLVYAADWG